MIQVRAFLVSIFALICGVATAYAESSTSGETGEPQPEEAIGALKFGDLLRDTGFLAVPLILLSILSVFLIIFYFATIHKGAIVSNRFMNQADQLIRKQDYQGLLAVCNRHNECISRVTAKTLDFATKNPTASFGEVREVTEAEGMRQASMLNQRIQYLADIGAVAPMVGLLGTVIGMIKSFRVISVEASIGAKQMGLASGVSEALLTTAGGLAIGIPCLVFYSIFRGRVQGLVAEMEAAAATHLMALLGSQYKRAAKAARGGPGNRRRSADQDYAHEGHGDTTGI